MRGVTWTYWGWAPAPGPLYAPFLVFFNTVLIYGLWRLVRARTAAGSSYHRNRIRLVILGTIVSLAGGAVDFLRFVVARVVPEAEHVYPIGIPANMVFALVVGTAILRYRLFDVSAVMKAVAAYGMVWAVSVCTLVGVLTVVARAGLGHAQRLARRGGRGARLYAHTGPARPRARSAHPAGDLLRHSEGLRPPPGAQP